MSLLSAMNSAVSGMNGQAYKISEIASNLANGSSVGHKRGEVGFVPMVTGSNGAGVFYQKTQDMSQGLVEPTQSNLDLSISGDGFFPVADLPNIASPNQQFSFARAGNFYRDANGYLRLPSGQYLLGKTTDQAGNITTGFAGTLTEMQAINVSSVQPFSRMSTGINIISTLPSSDPVGSSSQPYKNTISIIDSQGNKHFLEIDWTKTAVTATTQTWTCSVNVLNNNALEVREGNSTGTMPYSINVVFDTNGNPLSFNGSATAPDIFIKWNPAVTGSNLADQTISLNLGTVGQNNGVACKGAEFADTQSGGDGVETGSYTNVTIDERGLMRANFSNGQSIAIFQLFLAKFNNPAALQLLYGNSYTQSPASGQYQLHTPQQGGNGKLVSYSLETSNADSAIEFTNMIGASMAFGMNAKAIQTADELLSVLQNIKR